MIDINHKLIGKNRINLNFYNIFDNRVNLKWMYNNFTFILFAC